MPFLVVPSSFPVLGLSSKSLQCFCIFAVGIETISDIIENKISLFAVLIFAGILMLIFCER